MQSEVEKTIKKMRNKNSTGDDDVPGNVLSLLGEGGLKVLTKLSNTIYETGEWRERREAKLSITIGISRLKRRNS
jgi:hypothetical protein